MARRPLRTAGGVVAVVGAVMIASNALWDQTSRHPAPLWSADASDGKARAIVATHSPAGEDASAAASETAGPDGLVERIQQILAARGYFDGEIDGYLTAATVEAIKAFESDQGLPVTGEPSLTVLTAISEPIDEEAVIEPAPVETAAAPVTTVPTPGRVTNVQEIQAALNAQGYGPLTVDGVMGPRTQDALAKFAESRGMAGQGVTPAVLRALADPNG